MGAKSLLKSKKATKVPLKLLFASFEFITVQSLGTGLNKKSISFCPCLLVASNIIFCRGSSVDKENPKRDQSNGECDCAQFRKTWLCP